MRRYHCAVRGGQRREIFPGVKFNSRGLAHAANWNKCYGPEDLERYGITYEELPDPPESRKQGE